MRAALALIICAASPAFGEGFVQTDLTQITVDAAAFAPIKVEHKSEPARLTVACTSCDDTVAVDIQLSKSTDGTEGRFRSGETTVEKMRAICQSRSPTCKLDRADVGPAVGWVTQWEFADSPASTLVLFRDGDMLKASVFGASRDQVSGLMDTTIKTLVPQIVGE